MFIDREMLGDTSALCDIVSTIIKSSVSDLLTFEVMLVIFQHK